jgi:phage shock protein A
MNNNERKIAQAKAYLEMYADPQQARNAAAANNEQISSAQWEKAESQI